MDDKPFSDIVQRIRAEWNHVWIELGNLEECIIQRDNMNAGASIEAALLRLKYALNASHYQPSESPTKEQFELLRWVRILFGQLTDALERIDARRLTSELSQRWVNTALLIRFDITNAVNIDLANAARSSGSEQTTSSDPRNTVQADCNTVQPNATREAAESNAQGVIPNETFSRKDWNELTPLGLWVIYCGISGPTARRYAEKLNDTDKKRPGRQWLVRFGPYRKELEACRNAKLPKNPQQLRGG